MTFKDHGYYGYAYLGARITQATALLPIIGLVGNFLSLIAKSEETPPSELVATIVFSAISFLWVLLSMTAYHDTHIPYLATLTLDTLFLVPFVVFAVILGQPLSLTTCSALPAASGHVALPVSTLAGGGRPASYVVFAGAGQTVCYELMAVWGLTIALAVLFAVSAVSAGFLLLGKRRGGGGGGGYPMANDSQIEMAHAAKADMDFSRSSPSIGPNGGSVQGTTPWRFGQGPGMGFDDDDDSAPLGYPPAPRH